MTGCYLRLGGVGAKRVSTCLPTAQVIAFRPSVDMYGNLFNGGYTAGAVTRTTLTGFGRAIKVESGPVSLTYSASIHNIAISSVVSQVDSVYAPCGCSLMRK